jgi:uncharacterized protein (DUF2126 family)
MPIRVAVQHRTSYQYDRLVGLAPQVVRLRPAPHCRTPVLSYSLKVAPDKHFVNWQQDPYGNFCARLVFPDKARLFSVQVDLVAELTVINPFDFFVEPSADQVPFTYEQRLAKELRPFLETEPAGPKLAAYVAQIDRSPRKTVDFLVDLNRQLQHDIGYLIRMEPGIQACEQTLELRSGSCRDSAWLLVQLLRNLGLAARFVSGYLIQLVPDEKPVQGPAGPESDFTDLHAWAEVYLPGAGWIGLDPTSGLLAGEGHLPLACTADPSSAAPISGSVEQCQSEFHFTMSVTRIHEDPRVTKPYTDRQWSAIHTLGLRVDRHLADADVRLTMGGEPTFVSDLDMQGDEWRTAAMGPTKRILADSLLRRLADRYARGGLLHFGQGKWYPGEPLPRWALSCYWRIDGQPMWRNAALLADPESASGAGYEHAAQFGRTLCERLSVDPDYLLPACEDPLYYLWRERQLPAGLEPQQLRDGDARVQLARRLECGLAEPIGCVLPLQVQWRQSRPRWTSQRWPVRDGRVFLVPGDSAIGLRLPLESLWGDARSPTFPVDPGAPRDALPRYDKIRQQPRDPAARGLGRDLATDAAACRQPIVQTALCIEPRDGVLHVFMTPLDRCEDYLELLANIEAIAESQQLPVVIEGYPPPPDPRIESIKLTPDPGVLEVNIHPARSWDQLVEITTTLYEEARQCHLGTEKFGLDGRHTGTGGGNHVVLGGATPADSPFLRRPDLLRSLIAYWQNHPALSYLFSGMFIGPTSQAPRVDEGRQDALYELQLAFQQVPERAPCPPWLVDRIFRHLLVDVTGNTHRAEFCIDKLYSPDTVTGRLGLVEFRAFEMPPHARMSLVQQLLLRCLVARFWQQPYRGRLIPWGTALHDRFLLPHFVWRDFCDVVSDTRRAGFALEEGWFRPHCEFRFPQLGQFTQRDVRVELRQAIEPWYVLGEEPAGGGTTRFVDSSVERLQVLVDGLTESRYVVTCNGRRLPMHPTGQMGQYVAGVRYRAWLPPSCLHPTIPVHQPLVFDILDTWNERSLGGCEYHVEHPGGLNPETFPVNANEAESRRAARFRTMGHTPGQMSLPPEEVNPDFPLTLDLRLNALR